MGSAKNHIKTASVPWNRGGIYNRSYSFPDLNRGQRRAIKRIGSRMPGISRTTAAGCGKTKRDTVRTVPVISSMAAKARAAQAASPMVAQEAVCFANVIVIVSDSFAIQFRIPLRFALLKLRLSYQLEGGKVKSGKLLKLHRDKKENLYKQTGKCGFPYACGAVRRGRGAIRYGTGLPFPGRHRRKLRPVRKQILERKAFICYTFY